METESALERLLQEAETRRRVRLDAEARAGLKAMALAPTLEIYHALLRGEDVPVELLNQDALVRYGLRRK